MKIVAHNLSAMNAQRQYRIVSDCKAKMSENCHLVIELTGRRMTRPGYPYLKVWEGKSGVLPSSSIRVKYESGGADEKKYGVRYSL